MVCNEKTSVSGRRIGCGEHHVFPVPIVSNKTPKLLFHGQHVKTVAYLRVSTARQGAGSQRLAILGLFAGGGEILR